MDYLHVQLTMVVFPLAQLLYDGKALLNHTDMLTSPFLSSIIMRPEGLILRRRCPRKIALHRHALYLILLIAKRFLYTGKWRKTTTDIKTGYKAINIYLSRSNTTLLKRAPLGQIIRSERLGHGAFKARKTGYKYLSCIDPCQSTNSPSGLAAASSAARCFALFLASAKAFLRCSSPAF